MNEKGIFSTVAAGALWGLISLFTRNLNAMGFSSLQIVFFRVGFSVLIMFFWLLFTEKEALIIRWKDIWMFIGTGIVSLMMFNLCYFTTIQISEASIAVALLYTSPVFIMILSAILFHEQITRIKLISMIITVMGCSLSAGIMGSASLSAKVVIMGLGSGFFYGLYTIFSTVALKSYSSKTISFYTFLFGFIGAFFCCRPLQALGLMKANPSGILLAIGISIVCTIIPYTLYTSGISKLNSQLAGIFVTVEPVVGNLVGLLIWHEPVGFIRWLGMGMIILAIVILNPPSKKTA